jgi:hypothetical protein
VAPAESRLGEGAGEEGLADPGRAHDQDVAVGRHPVGLGEVQDERALKAARAREVEVLDTRGGAQLGRPKVALEAQL